MILFAILGLAMTLIVLWDAFETVILPRRITRRIRLSRIFTRTIWKIWRLYAKSLSSESSRKEFLSYYGPLALLLLIIMWATGLILGYALIDLGLQIPLTGLHGSLDFPGYLIASAATLLPLDFHEFAPTQTIGQLSSIIEAATGYAFIAIIIGYFPILYQAFSTRETSINLLDSRAGSPPNAIKLLKNSAGKDKEKNLSNLLAEWEVWCAQLLESTLSYPILAFYRSQHDNQSWLATLLMILDVSALVQIGVDGVAPEKGKYTFTIARHAVKDLTKAFFLIPQSSPVDRLPKKDFQKFCITLKKHGITLKNGTKAKKELRRLRASYEPYVEALSSFFLMPIQPLCPESEI